MSKKDFHVGIMHSSGSTDYLIIKEIVLECGFTPRILLDESDAGIIFENLRDLIWEDAHCVIVVMTKDDEMKSGAKRARQNVVFELGYCFAAFETLSKEGLYKRKNAIIVVAEKDVELFTDIDGLNKIIFESNSLGNYKKKIKETLEKSYSKAKLYYKELKE